MADTPADDYDTPWKDAITRYFPEFMAFYFPDAHARIDWSRGYTFLDQELAQIVKDAELGKRLVDNLAQVATLDGDECWVYIHVEVQGNHDTGFPERLFTYNYRLYDKYKRPIASLAILADNREHWKPDRFGYELFGCSMGIRIPVVKLLDYQPRLDALLTDPNPFALVTAAHLLTRQTKDDPVQRLAAKWRLAKLLYQRDWDKQRIIDLFSVIDWMMQVPQELQKQLWQDIQQLERNQQMPYITSVERIGIEKGVLQGMELGRQEGRLEGKLEGLLEGKLEGLLEGKLEGQLEGQAVVLKRQLTKRFGPLSADVGIRLGHATQEQLETWSDRILDADSLEAVFADH